MVLVRDIPFHSLCAHHLLPFIAVADLAYCPGLASGLSKLARVSTTRSAPADPERLTRPRFRTPSTNTSSPRGVGVAIEATHLCMSIRGVEAPGATTVTTAVRGAVRDDPSTRAEFTRLTTARPRGV